MKNYFNKGLLYKEFKNLYAFIGVNCIYVFMAIIYPFLENIDSIRKRLLDGETLTYEFLQGVFNGYFSNASPRHLGCIFMIIAATSVIIGFDFIGKKYESLSSMPYTKEEIIINKWFAMFLSAIVPIGLGFAVVHLIYLSNKDILSIYMTGKMIFTWGSLNILVYIFVLTFIMLIQCLSGKNIIGGIVGGILLIFPMGISMLILSMGTLFAMNPKYGDFAQINYGKIGEHIINISHKLSIIMYNANSDLDCSYITRRSEAYFSTKIRVIILILTICILFILMVYVFKKVPLERIGYIVMFRPLEIIFKIGVSCSFGILGGTITSNTIQSRNGLWRVYANEAGKIIIPPDMKIKSIEEYTSIVTRGEILTVLVAMLCGCVTYVIVNKIIEMNKK